MFCLSHDVHYGYMSGEKTDPNFNLRNRVVVPQESKYQETANAMKHTPAHILNEALESLPPAERNLYQSDSGKPARRELLNRALENVHSAAQSRRRTDTPEHEDQDHQPTTDALYTELLDLLNERPVSRLAVGPLPSENANVALVQDENDIDADTYEDQHGPVVIHELTETSRTTAAPKSSSRMARIMAFLRQRWPFR